MQSSDGFTYDGGPSHTQIPAGSRLHQYLGANRQAGSFTPGSSVQLHAPPFIPKHQQQHQHNLRPMGMQESPNSQFPFNNVSGFSRNAPPFEQQNRYQQENRGGTMYFYPPVMENTDDEPYDDRDFGGVHDGHVVVNTQGMYAYHSPLPVPHVGKFRPKGANGNGQTQFISPELKMEMMNRQLAIDAKADTTVYPDLPQQIEHLTNIVPLETNITQNSQTTYKAASIRDGVTYCIRRISGFRPQPGKQTQTIESWKKIVHGNIVQLKEVISNCRAFGDNSLILIYDYYPLAETLKAKHFGTRNGIFVDSLTGVKLTSNMAGGNPLGCGIGIAETTLWSYVIQISAALRAIHSSGLAARSIALNKIILFGNNKILLTLCGLKDILQQDNQNIHDLQQEDMQDLGFLLLSLATGKIHDSYYPNDVLKSSLNIVAQSYSSDMKNLISYLLSCPTNTRKSIHDIMPMIGARFYSYMENMQNRCDCMEAELTKEMENGRLFRLLAKMNTVLERAEYYGDENWSETGDRYMLKLFRDYVFHSVTDQGKPWLDMAHIIQCLNKLDAGTSEKIEMVSRDGLTQIIVDYAQLKRCLESSYRDLLISNVILRH